MTRQQRIHTCCALLRALRDELKACHAPRAAAKVRRALKSAEGAERHAWGDEYRDERKARAK